MTRPLPDKLRTIPDDYARGLYLEARRLLALPEGDERKTYYFCWAIGLSLVQDGFSHKHKPFCSVSEQMMVELKPKTQQTGDKQ